MYKNALLLLSMFTTTAAVPAAQSPAIASDRRQVIVATRRDHRVIFFDADSLRPLGSFVVNNLASNVSVSGDGTAIFVTAAQTKAGNGCCALFALKLRERTICEISYPVLHSTTSPVRDDVLFQRGNVGIE